MIISTHPPVRHITMVVCPVCDHEVRHGLPRLATAPVLRILYRWDRAYIGWVDRVTDRLVLHGDRRMPAFCDADSTRRGSGWGGDLCDCCHPIHGS